MVYQISVFLENRAGQLAEITKVLADAGVDLRAISIAETADYGLVRLIVDDYKRASEILTAHGDMISVNKVWAVAVPDEPAGLSKLLQVLAASQVNVAYMYSLFTHKEGLAYMVMRVSNEPKFLGALGDRKIRIVSAEELGLK